MARLTSRGGRRAAPTTARKSPRAQRKFRRTHVLPDGWYTVEVESVRLFDSKAGTLFAEIALKADGKYVQLGALKLGNPEFDSTEMASNRTTLADLADLPEDDEFDADAVAEKLNAGVTADVYLVEDVDWKDNPVNVITEVAEPSTEE